MNNSRSYFIDIFAILALSFALYLGLSFMRPLASPDEGRYSEIPREMVADSDYVTPRLNGAQYFYKPPMFYWMQAGAIKACGINRVSLRFANSAMAILGILVTYCAARALYNRKTGLASAAVLATSLLYFALGQIITLDMTVSVFISAALMAFIVALKRSGIWRGALIVLFFIFAALAVLTKGLIGVVIPAAVIVLYAICYGPISFFKQLKISDLFWGVLGLALFFLVSVPWHVLASIANPAYETSEGIFSKNWEGQGFFWYYIIHEHILRYVDSATSMRAQPFWFFFVFAPVGLIPWLFILPQACFDQLKDGWKNMRKKNPEFIFFSVWILFVVLFFSISRSKLVPYIIPIYPAFAVILGVWIAKLWENPKAFKTKIVSWCFIVGGFAVSIAPAFIYFILEKKGKLLEPQFTAYVCAALGVSMLAVTIVALRFYLKGNFRAFMVGVFVAVCTLFAYFNPLGMAFQRPSAENIAYKIKELRKDGDFVAIAFNYGLFQDLPVWLDELPMLWGGAPEEQKFGVMREREKLKKRFIDTPEDVKKLIASSNGVFYVAVEDDDIQKLEKFTGIKPQIIMNTGQLCLVKIKK